MPSWQQQNIEGHICIIIHLIRHSVCGAEEFISVYIYGVHNLYWIHLDGWIFLLLSFAKSEGEKKTSCDSAQFVHKGPKLALVTVISLELCNTDICPIQGNIHLYQ